MSPPKLYETPEDWRVDKNEEQKQPGELEEMDSARRDPDDVFCGLPSSMSHGRFPLLVTCLHWVPWASRAESSAARHVKFTDQEGCYGDLRWNESSDPSLPMGPEGAHNAKPDSCFIGLAAVSLEVTQALTSCQMTLGMKR